jgi:hypothetical protein
MTTRRNPLSVAGKQIREGAMENRAMVTQTTGVVPLTIGGSQQDHGAWSQGPPKESSELTSEGVNLSGVVR